MRWKKPDCSQDSADNWGDGLSFQVDEIEYERQVLADEYDCPNVADVSHVAQNLQRRDAFRIVTTTVDDL